MPDRVLQLIGMQMPEYIGEAPGCRFLVSLPYRLVKARVAQMLFGTVHVERFRRHIRIAAPDGRLVGRQMLREVTPEARVPLQLVRVFRGVNFETVRDRKSVV